MNLYSSSKETFETLSIAPMLKKTNRHCRYFFRLIHPTVLLYTEMVTTGAILFGDQKKHLDFNAEEHPIALQLGGSDPETLAECATIAEQWGYDEVNLNVGCPSGRVQSGQFGVCLMNKPDLVAECVAAMKKRISIPITVKTRIGVDHQDSYEYLHRFVQTVSEAGCETFIIHARKAWLKGLSPKENRNIPSLNYERVYQIKKTFPTLEIVINGGIQTVEQAKGHLNYVDGVMIGRAAYQNPYLLASFVDHPLSRIEILEQYLNYLKTQTSKGISFACLAQPILGLFYGQPKGKLWRRLIGEGSLGKDNLQNNLIQSIPFDFSCKINHPH